MTDMTEDQTQHYKNRLVEIIGSLDQLESVAISFRADQRNTFYEIRIEGRRIGAIEPDEMMIEEGKQ